MTYFGHRHIQTGVRKHYIGHVGWPTAYCRPVGQFSKNCPPRGSVRVRTPPRGANRVQEYGSVPVIKKCPPRGSLRVTTCLVDRLGSGPRLVGQIECRSTGYQKNACLMGHLGSGPHLVANRADVCLSTPYSVLKLNHLLHIIVHINNFWLTIFLYPHIW